MILARLFFISRQFLFIRHRLGSFPDDTLNRVSTVVFGFFPFQDHVGFVIFEDIRCTRRQRRIEWILDNDTVRWAGYRGANAVHIFGRDSNFVVRKKKLRSSELHTAPHGAGAGRTSERTDRTLCPNGYSSLSEPLLRSDFHLNLTRSPVGRPLTLCLHEVASRGPCTQSSVPST